MGSNGGSGPRHIVRHPGNPPGSRSHWPHRCWPQRDLPRTHGAGELCDRGADNGWLVGDCAGDCLRAVECGDGIIDPAEFCDNGVSNLTGEGTCNGTCDGFQTCGDGVVEGTEACDDVGCKSQCEGPAVCGDGELDPGEACDDGPSSEFAATESDGGAAGGFDASYFGVELGHYERHFAATEPPLDNEQTEARNNKLAGFSPLTRLASGTFLSEAPVVLSAPRST